jgi:hypothetical protein
MVNAITGKRWFFLVREGDSRAAATVHIGNGYYAINVFFFIRQVVNTIHARPGRICGQELEAGAGTVSGCTFRESVRIRIRISIYEPKLTLNQAKGQQD